MLRPGSSPRGRGKLEPLDDNRDRCRLIPARAGKTGHVNDGFGGHRGSSPRGRGKRNPCDSAEKPGWLIPARAGKTLSEARFPTGRGAHPRAGGENPTLLITTPHVQGSSPRGRGKRPPGSPRPHLPRLIPARAGKTISCSFSFAFASAHPRAGGENPRPDSIFFSAGGSSPRGRGKLSGGHILPRIAVAHPRAGGENCLSPRG